MNYVAREHVFCLTINALCCSFSKSCNYVRRWCFFLQNFDFGKFMLDTVCRSFLLFEDGSFLALDVLFMIVIVIS